MARRPSAITWHPCASIRRRFRIEARATRRRASGHSGKSGHERRGMADVPKRRQSERRLGIRRHDSRLGTSGDVGLIPPKRVFPRLINSQSVHEVDHGVESIPASYPTSPPPRLRSSSARSLWSAARNQRLERLRDFVHSRRRLPARIADVLSAYDDLIENNRRRMALLEDAARQLYREWFVRLRFPGHEHTRITDGVPEGWERRKLGDVMTLKRGYDLPEADRVAGDIPVVSSSGITGRLLKKA